MKKLTDLELERVHELIEDKLHSIGCVEFMIAVRPYFKKYLAISSVIMLLFIYFESLPLWLFFIPLIPIIVLNIIEWIDLNIMVYSLNKIHNELIQEEILVDWDSLFEITVECLEKKVHNQNQNNNEKQQDDLS